MYKTWAVTNHCFTEKSWDWAGQLFLDRPCYGEFDWLWGVSSDEYTIARNWATTHYRSVSPERTLNRPYKQKKRGIAALIVTMYPNTRYIMLS